MNKFTDISAISSSFNAPGGRVLIGIDGYVDEVWQVVESRADNDNYTIFKRFRQFGEHLLKYDEGGMAAEIIRKRRIYGGFTANTGNASICLGVGTVLLSMFGKDVTDPVFSCFDRNNDEARIVSIGDPAVCHIFEFDDGKMMFPYNKAVNDLDWGFLTNAVPLDLLQQIMREADIIALGYWSNMHAFDDLVVKFYDILSGGDGNQQDILIGGGKRQRMFFDFADIRKREIKALDDTLSMLGGIGESLPMTLSLNEHEADLLFSHLDEPFSMEAFQAEESAKRVREKTGLDEIVVHTPHFALSASLSEGVISMPQKYCNNPARTTGAGDTFNGAYISAYAKKLAARERLAVSNATVGFFIRNGYAPNKEEMLMEIEEMHGEIGAF